MPAAGAHVWVWAKEGDKDAAWAAMGSEQAGERGGSAA